MVIANQETPIYEAVSFPDLACYPPSREDIRGEPYLALRVNTSQIHKPLSRGIVIF